MSHVLNPGLFTLTPTVHPDKHNQKHSSSVLCTSSFLVFCVTFIVLASLDSGRPLKNVIKEQTEMSALKYDVF